MRTNDGRRGRFFTSPRSRSPHHGHHRAETPAHSSRKRRIECDANSRLADSDAPGPKRRKTGQETRPWVFSTRDFSACRDRFVIVSYNILGVENALKHPDLYKHVEPENLDWNQRKRRIRRELRRYSPSIMVRLSPSSVTCPIPFSSRGRELSSSDGGRGSASWTPAMLDFLRRYMFTRPEDLPRARVVWVSTAQTNFRKSMWEAQDKAAKTTDSQDPIGWMDYGSRHKLERTPTFCELFDRTHKWKGMDDSVSESARTIGETYDRTMADRYVEGTPQPDLDPEAWVNATGGPRKGRVYDFRDSLDTTLV
ncbi:hypothetical protein Taro_052673 [Colocasia esculenta]|uniref:Uncharacterized protein n=1 Tax=Colocasia esculenta TaxID=4460 RepID=A0A843XJ74_COLES|nr:hypothetical protein [Colocasia esculenta]